MEQQPKKGFFRKLLDKYNALCDDLGVDNGACRSCVPVVKFDENEQTAEKIADKNEKNQK